MAFLVSLSCFSFLDITRTDFASPLLPNPSACFHKLLSTKFLTLQWVPSTKWEQKMKEITWSFDDRSPRFRHNAWRTPFEDQTKDSPLTLQTADPMFSL